MDFELIYNVIGQILPFTWLEPTFMKRALLALLVISPICAMMGVLMVNFRMSFFSDAISHSAFTGIALGVLFNVNPYLTMILFGAIVGIGITRAKRGTELSIDAVIGVFFSAAVALGIAIVSAKKGLTRNLQSFLYGDILAISDSEILWFIGFFILIVLFMIYSYNKLMLMGINDNVAKVSGIAVQNYEYFFAILLALTITFSIRAIGILLVTAMLIVPASAGRNFARSAIEMFWYSIIISIFSAIVGLALSYYFDSATGATIILIAVACFILTHIAKMIRERL
ncbi:TPA: metal ABC transporter permease [Candidatus Poribacteria bacterium]|nr:metal ABC transporter permease [Candidatus Poribacteria bacterium]